MIGCYGRINHEVELRHAPWRLIAVRWYRKILDRGRTRQGVNQGEIGQGIGQRTKQQIVGLHRGKIFAIDPNEIDRAPGLLSASCNLGTNPRNSVGSIAQLHMTKADAIGFFNLIANPVNIGVDALIPPQAFQYTV